MNLQVYMIYAIIGIELIERMLMWPILILKYGTVRTICWVALFIPFSFALLMRFHSLKSTLKHFYINFH